MNAPMSLTEAVEQQLASGSVQLPVYSATAMRLESAVSKGDVTTAQIEEILGQDPALAVQVLRVANSSFYGGLSKVNTISAAVMRLGQKQIVNIATLTAQRSAHTATDPALKALMERLWQHAVGCAMGAKWLAEHAGCKAVANEAFLAGLMHDVGALLVVKVIESLRSGDNGRVSLTGNVVMEAIDTLHASLGARLIRHWQLPEALAEVAANHHADHPEAGDVIGQLVRLANATCCKLGYDLVPDASIRLSVLPEVEMLGVRDVTLAELEIAIEDGIAALA